MFLLYNERNNAPFKYYRPVIVLDDVGTCIYKHMSGGQLHTNEWPDIRSRSKPHCGQADK